MQDEELSTFTYIISFNFHIMQLRYNFVHFTDEKLR